VIVVDASVVLDVLLRTEHGVSLADRILSPEASLHAPHLLDIEVAQVLRRYERRGEISQERGRQALEDLADLPVKRYAHDALLPRIWQLRGNLTAYDAAYVALAEALPATLLTGDARLAAAPGHQANIEHV
jgi:predicted nucleic acid-binding protein